MSNEKKKFNKNIKKLKRIITRFHNSKENFEKTYGSLIELKAFGHVFSSINR